jgi:DNA helicase-2/ATP-dependent DNA helicase PcrA
MEEGIFPSDKDGESDDAMSEERRLAYVAITRAKEKLFITHSRERMMYGRTRPGFLSRFVKSEIPESLIENDMPRTAPPRQTAYSSSVPKYTPYKDASSFSVREMRRAPSVNTSSPARKSAKDSYGIEKLAVGVRVRHGAFGDGSILSARDMGGDVLYEVRFDNGQVKKLMATFAKLKKL